jgi:hypothetical protein
VQCHDGWYDPTHISVLERGELIDSPTPRRKNEIDLINPSSRTMALGSNEPLTDMSNRGKG